MSDHESFRDLAGAYALGALGEDERRQFEAHLATCAECAREVRDMVEVAAGLGGAVEQRDPPARLRARVMAVTGRDTRAGAGVPPWFAVAASIALVALGAYAASLRLRISSLEAEVERQQARVALFESQMADITRTVAPASPAARILSAPDLQRIELAGQAAAPGASGRAYWSRSRGLIVTATDLPPLPAGKTYQLWVIGASGPISAGLLAMDEAGRATALAPPIDVAPAAVAVTIEPAGGVAAPTGDKYLVGTT